MRGQTISHYEILEKLGEGGMGVVYKAEDTRLHRTVALKFLRAESVEDEELTTRFRHEAEAAASLDHSNICTIHEIDEAEGQVFLAMAFVDGPSLKEAIAERPLKLEVALDLGIQIAEGLAAAHEAGIVHRDIKPGNILMNRRRQAKILDFGLAHLGAATQITKTGTIIGTPAYMSPEQVRGEKTDTRTDIWSLGVVLYEMLTGRVPFQGESGQAVALSIQNEQPEPPTALRSDIPKELDRIVRKALTKDPNGRYQHIEDLLVDLRRLKQDSGSGSGQQLPIGPGKQRTGLYVAAALMIAALVAWLAVRQRPQEAANVQPTVTPLTTYPGRELYPAFSPDGNDIAFSWAGAEGGNFDIFRQQIGPGEPIQLTRDPADDLSPVWSPDGKWIAFQRSVGDDRAKVILIPALGGAEELLIEVHRQGLSPGELWYRRLAWSPDGGWLTVPEKPTPESPFALYLLSRGTREKRQLTLPPATFHGDTGPAFSPDGSTLAFCRRTGIYGANQLYLLDLSSDLEPVGEPRRLALDHEQVANPSWTPDGKEIVFVSRRAGARELWMVPVSGGVEARRLPVGQDVDLAMLSPRGDRLAYARTIWTNSMLRLKVPSPGEPPGAPNLLPASSTRVEFFPRYSPDGSRIAFQSNRSGAYEIWICDADGGQVRQVTFFGRDITGTPRWSPDGRHIAFDSTAEEGQTEIYRVAADGGKPVRLTRHPAHDYVPSWSRDGEWIYFASGRTGGDARYDGRIWKISSQGGEATQIAGGPGFTSSESTDGNWLYYLTTVGGGSLWRVPVNGGREEKILDEIEGRCFEVMDDGIYFCRRPEPDGESTLHFHDFATTTTQLIVPVSNSWTISPDRQWVVYTEDASTESDLMLVENFR